MEPYALQAGEGRTYRYGINMTVKLGELHAGRGAAVAEYTTCQGEEPPDHTHSTEDEVFYVLSGTLTFRCGGQSFDVGTGGFVFLPQGVEHGYTIRSDAPVHLLVVTFPTRTAAHPGWGGFIADVEAQGELVAEPKQSSKHDASTPGT